MGSDSELCVTYTWGGWGVTVNCVTYTTGGWGSDSELCYIYKGWIGVTVNCV